MVPRGKLFSNLHSTGKLKVLEESGTEDTFNPRLWTFLTYSSSEKPRFSGASAFHHATWDKARQEGPSSETLPHPRISDSEKARISPVISRILQSRHLSESLTLLTEASLGDTQLL